MYLFYFFMMLKNKGKMHCSLSAKNQSTARPAQKNVKDNKGYMFYSTIICVKKLNFRTVVLTQVF